MFSFPRAVVTRYHKLGGLEQQKFVLSQFQSPEDWSQCPVVEMKVSAGTYLLPSEVLGSSVLLTFCSFWWPQHSLAVATSLTSLPLCQISLCLSLIYIYIWLHLQLTQIIQDHQFISRSLITYANVIFALSSNILRFQGLGCGCLWKHHFSLPHLSPLRV